MGAQMDNPLDGRRAPEAPPVDEYDGGIYADGCQVLVRSKRSERGITLGGPIAEAQNAATAAEIARRCAAFEPMLAALKRAEQFIVNGVDLGFIRLPDATTPDPAHQTLPAVRAAIAQAEGR